MKLRLALVGVAVVACLGSVAYAASLTVSAAKVTAFARCQLWTSGYDSWVDEGSPNATNGSTTVVRVRSSGNNRRAFVHFDVVGSCALPAGAQVVNATVSLFMTSAPAASRTYELRRATASWAESSVTWNNQPSVTGVSSTVSTGTLDNVRLSWDVTTDVQAFVGGTTNDGWRVSDAAENSGTAYATVFASQENGTASRRPQLTVRYYP